VVASRASPSTRATTASAPRILSVPPRDVERLVARAVHRFDPATGAWEALADMPIELTGHRAVAMGPDIYVVGGGSGRRAGSDRGLSESSTCGGIGRRESLSRVGRGRGRA
jgi:hypothetical protein